MNTQNSYNSCEHVKSEFSLYPLLHAALLWCGVPKDQLTSHTEKAIEISRGIFSLPYMTCLEPRCRLIHDAINKGVLPVCREDGYPVEGHVKPERRHLRGKDLRSWIAEEYPNDKPAFLFDEIERKTHSSITTDVYLALKAEKEALTAKLIEITRERDDLLMKSASLESCIKKMTPSTKEVGDRAETTFLNIIGGLLGLMLGNSPSGQKQSIYNNQASIISALLGHYSGKAGITDRTLEQKFSDANKSIKN